MAYETILTDLSENIFTITINRPDKLNALNLTMIREFIDAFDAADADDAARAIIVTGAGRAFCAGADLSLGGGTFDREARAGPPAGAERAGRQARPFPRQRARRRRPHDAAHVRLQQAGDRGGERPGGRHRRHHAAADGRAHRLERGALRLRVLAARHRAGGGVELFPAAHRRHRAGARLVLFGPRVRRRGGARRQARQPRGRAGGTDPGGARAGAQLHRRDRAGVDRADPADDVAHARRQPPDGGAPHRQQGDVPSRPLGRREGGHRVVSGEAPGRFSDTVSRDLPELPLGEEPTYR